MITFGSDPEFMITNKQGILKSAIGIVNGTKENRFDLGKGHKAYYDNVLAECQIAPSQSAEEAIENFGECFKRYAKHIAPYIMKPQASAIYPESECQHDDAKKFGCDPEFCAYEVMVCDPPECTTTFRSGGGHIHIGFQNGVKLPEMTNEEKEIITWNRIWVIRMCDLFIGIPSVLIDHDPTSKERRKLYGGAGTHRIPPHGVEYRSLSNFWCAEPKKVALMYDLSNFIVEEVLTSGLHLKLWDKEIAPNQLKKTINSGDDKNAQKIYQDIVLKYLPKKLASQINKFLEPTTIDFYKAWNIKC